MIIKVISRLHVLLFVLCKCYTIAAQFYISFIYNPFCKQPSIYYNYDLLDISLLSRSRLGAASQLNSKNQNTSSPNQLFNRVCHYSLLLTTKISMSQEIILKTRQPQCHCPVNCNHACNYSRSYLSSPCSLVIIIILRPVGLCYGTLIAYNIIGVGKNEQ